jgi:DNA-binding HxlR family transcriptional regulator
MAAVPRSHCATNLSVELLGDRWTLLILRDMLFFDRRHFGQLLDSPEHIASNVLAKRLKMLVAEGMLTRGDDPTHKQKAIYSLTEKSISLFPILVQLSLWGRDNLPNSIEQGPEIWAVMEGGPKTWAPFMARLRESHLGAAPSQGESGRTDQAANPV